MTAQRRPDVVGCCISQITTGERSHDVGLVAPTSRRSGARSRLGGVRTVLPPVADMDLPSGQLSLPITEAEPVRSRREVLPWVVHVPAWLDLEVQRCLVADFRRWASPPAGLRHPRMPTGHLMSVQSVCLGWHWQPYAYTRTADDTDGAPVKPLPVELVDLARAAVGSAYGPSSPEAATYSPDAAIVNLYAPGARLGLHQDGEEPSDAPVVTLSLGDTCAFRLAGIDRRIRPFTDIELHSGDLLVFGGPSRRIYHGVPKVFPDTAPDRLGLPPGRLSITIRQTGFA